LVKVKKDDVLNDMNTKLGSMSLGTCGLISLVENEERYVQFREWLTAQLWASKLDKLPKCLLTKCINRETSV